MKAIIFSAHSFEKPFLMEINKTHQHELVFFEDKLTIDNASLATGFPIVSCFVTDNLQAEVLKILSENGTQLIALRSAGFNHVDLAAAKAANLILTRVPRYSPYAVAEFATALILCLNRKLHHAYNRIQKHNFTLDGLLGFDLKGKTVGVIGTGTIGATFAKIMQGFGCHILANDLIIDPECAKMGIEYVTLSSLYQQVDILSLHCPLTTATHHLINQQAIDELKRGVMLINTGRGALIDTIAVIGGLKSGKIGYLGMDVYEKEENLFFQDLSSSVIQDEIFIQLQALPNVLITGHQAFFTQEALTQIAQITLETISAFSAGTTLENRIYL